MGNCINVISVYKSLHVPTSVSSVYFIESDMLVKCITIMSSKSKVMDGSYHCILLPLLP